MEFNLGKRLKHAFNAFMNRDPTFSPQGYSYSTNPDRPRFSRGNERSIVTSVCNRIALDVAAITINHTRVDENGKFLEIIDDGLNKCLSLEANVDQTARAFIQDIVISMFDEGSVAMVPIDMILKKDSSSFDVESMRTGEILEWYPSDVKVRVYNDKLGKKEDIIVPKKRTGILENPLYAVMNEPNATMQRLIRKLNILDAIDNQSGSGKLDLIIQLPYATRNELKKREAEERRKSIEDQLTGTKYGIAYIDATEHITQLNRSVDNNLLTQIEYLTDQFYSQLGITKEVMDGTADEKTMQNYYSRSIEPIVSVIVDESKRKFITKTARSQGQSISYFMNPFRMIPISNIADIADKFTRNEILSSNEVRALVGYKPSKDPKADQLINSNISQAKNSNENENQETNSPDNNDINNEKGGENQNGL